jgi:hypothetical protein
MRKWVVLWVAVLGAAAGILVATEDAAACHRKRCWTPCYSPPPCSYGYAFAPACPVAPPGYAAAPGYPFPPTVVAPPPVAARAVVIRGRTHYILPAREVVETEKEELLPPSKAFARPPDVSDRDMFNGSVRKIAKVTVFGGETREFASVQELRAFLADRGDDDAMSALHIGHGVDVNRVEQEKLNVSVRGVIYTFTKESDNDYHVIIGDPPGTPGRKYLNAEVSGIPDVGTDENRANLVRVRQAFKEAFGVGDDGPDGYHPLDPPVPVRITGSLFWDVEHKPPHTVGPSFAAPKTAWEIHPISDIEFLD